MAKKKPTDPKAKSFASKQADPFVIDMGFGLDLSDPTFIQAGWIPPDDRTREEQRQHERFIEDTPLVREVFSGPMPQEDKPAIWEVVKQAIAKGIVSAEYVRNNTLKNITQLIGSCVGWSAGNMLFWSSVIDAMILEQPELIIAPFPGYHYGRGRLAAGIRGSGSGSTGSGQAKALQDDGYLAHTSLDVPKPTFGDSIFWTKGIETEWSNGANIGEKYLAEGRQHRTPNVARVSTIEEADQLLDSWHLFTIASNWGGKMKCPVVDGVLLNSRSGTWSHQMSVLARRVHPTLGKLYYVVNNWAYPHGLCPTGAPEGGFWIKEADMKWIIGQRETFAFSDAQGFRDKSREFDWSGMF